MKKSTALGFIFLLSFFFFSPQWIRANASTILFQDDFENGNINGWISVRGPNLWQFKNINGNTMYGARIASGNTIIDSVAKTINTPNYRIDFDYIPIANTNTTSIDRNLDFRWIYDSNSGSYSPYEVHFLGNNSVWTNFGYPQFTSPASLIDNQINHITIILQNQHIKFLLNGIKIIDYLDTTYNFSGGERIGLRVSTGGAYPTEAWFDNIIVTSLDGDTYTSLNVPYFSQNKLPWGPTEYDHAIKLGFNDPTMDRWGCAVTSAAMVLRFHNINKLADGRDIDPGSLNDWLKNNNGYLTGKGSDGYYSYFNWPVIGKLTKQLFDSGKANVKLMHKRAYPSSHTTDLLNEDLNKFPDILRVNNSQTSSHFVVAKGRSSDTYLINDPEWSYPTLSLFNNNYTQVDRYIPSQTNLSYIVAVVNPSVELLITDPQNNRTGKYFLNGQVLEVNDINNATYSLQAPISNPNDAGTPENLGTGVNEFLLPEPENGEYEIKLSSDKTVIYEINISTFQKDGKDKLSTLKGVVNKNHSDTIKINYSQDGVDQIEKVITWEDLINDLNELIDSNQIKNNGIYTSLLAKINLSQLSEDFDKKTSSNILNTLLNELDAQRGRNITEDAYQILSYDVNYLKNL